MSLTWLTLSPMTKASSRTLAAAGMAFFILILTATGLLNPLNRSFLDASLRLQSRHIHPPTDSVLVMIDEPAIKFMQEKYNQRWPWSRDAFAALFLALRQAGADQIVVDLMFLENSDRTELDDLLGSYAAAIDGLILAAPKGKYPVFWPAEFRRTQLQHNWEKRVGRVDYKSDPDGVVRHYDWDNSLAQRAAPEVRRNGPLLLRWYGGLAQLPREQVLSAEKFLERGYGPNGLLSEVKKLKVDEYNPAALRTALSQISAIPGKSVRGKTVFVGTNAAGTFDVKAVPVSSLEPGVLVHFTAWANARQNLFIPEIGLGLRYTFSTVVAILLAWSLTFWGWSRPNVGLLTVLTLTGIIAVLFASYFLLPFLLFPPMAPVASFFMGFAVLTTRHWIDESRLKREVQEMFGSYVSPAIVQRLLEHPESIPFNGEKKELTAYFSDLAGFTDMSEKMAPEQLMEIVNLYLSEMSEFILEENGYLDKYIGDAIMGVFGAPEPLPNHALAACRAALKSRDHLIELNKRLSADHGHALYARIGINSGEMIVGNIGSGRKRNYTVVGDPVNLASRLEGANKEFGSTILLGARTEELARAEIVTRPVELLRVKGKKQPIQTYELLALKMTADAQVLEFSSSFAQAYDSYQHRLFAHALPLFEKALRLRPDDKLCQLYIDRCLQLQREPPAPDWDGVYDMTHK